ncbi:amino acid permease [Sphingomonas sediminicola]|jgi:APA family basic amino acid/polyamine antiporter|uniref:APC family permease n=1 Tax=Sphingomonas sediminicola TaxID=386874 RepID=UPI003CF7BD99
MGQEPVQLRRVLDAALGAAIVVGGSIGLGILSMPGIIAGKLGDPFLIIAAWIAGGLFTFLGANIYAELGTAFPKAGGPYVYVREAAGPFAGFVTGWSDTAISVIATAAQAAAFGLYLENDVLDSRAVAIAELGVLFAVNWFGLKVGARTQQALSLFKVGGLVLLALACLALGGVKPPSDVQLFEHGFGLAGMIAALMLVTETYAGWNSGVYFSEEDKDSDRNVPRALFWGIGAMMGAYLLVNLGFLSLLSMSELSSSNLPAADAAQRIFGSEAGTIVTIFAVISLLGVANVSVMYTPRIPFAMSRDGVLPAAFATINRYGSPSWGLFAFTLPAMALVMLKSFDFLFTVTAFLGVAINGAVYAAFFVLRSTAPEIRRPYVARWYPWAPGFVVAISVALLIASLITDPEPAIWAIIAIGLSWPVYRWVTLSIRRSKRTILIDLPD